MLRLAIPTLIPFQLRRLASPSFLEMGNLRISRLTVCLLTLTDRTALSFRLLSLARSIKFWIHNHPAIKRFQDIPALLGLQVPSLSQYTLLSSTTPLVNFNQAQTERGHYRQICHHLALILLAGAEYQSVLRTKHFRILTTSRTLTYLSLHRTALLPVPVLAQLRLSLLNYSIQRHLGSRPCMQDMSQMRVHPVYLCTADGVAARIF